MPKPKNQKRKEAILRMQKQIDGWYKHIDTVKWLASKPEAKLPSEEAAEKIVFAEDKIGKLQQTIRYTEMALQPSMNAYNRRIAEIHELIPEGPHD
jgi:hypothetical protein